MPRRALPPIPSTAPPPAVVSSSPPRRKSFTTTTTATANKVSPNAHATMTPPSLVTRLMLFTFDELRGTSLITSYPRGVCDVISHSDAELAEICLPDGGHTRDHDGINIILKRKNGGGSNRNLFGYGAFRNYRDHGATRGARQATLLLLSRCSHLDMFRPLLVTALDACMSFCRWDELECLHSMLKSLKKAIDLGFSNLASNTAEVNLWGRVICIERPLLSEIGGASLRDMVMVFRERIMILWHTAVTEKRLLFCAPGMTAASVSTLVLAMPLLVGELGTLIMDSLEPYVTLAVVHRLNTKSTFVAGCNNVLFSMKQQWWDVCADVTTGQVKDQTNIRVTGADMAFISRLLHELQRVPRSEAWVRRQFHDFTLSFLNRVGGRKGTRGLGDLSEVLAALTLRVLGNAPSTPGMIRNAKFADEFSNSKLWRRYRQQQDSAWGGSTSTTMENAPPPQSPSMVLESPHRPRSLARKDSNCSTHSMVVDGGGAGDDMTFDFNHDGGLKSQAPFALSFAGGRFRPPTGFLQEKIVKLTYSPLTVGLGPPPPPPPPPQASPKTSPMKRSLVTLSKNLMHPARPPLRGIPANDNNHNTTTSSTVWVTVTAPSSEDGDDGDTYLWNVETGETKWPSNGGTEFDDE